MYNYRAVYRYEQMGGFCLKKGRISALLPILVFLVLYLGLGITFEYIMKIPMGFYNVPIIVAFLASIFVASIQNRAVSFDEKLEIMALQAKQPRKQLVYQMLRTAQVRLIQTVVHILKRILL